MDVASEVIELFTTRDLGRAQQLAAKLERLNRERRRYRSVCAETIEARLATEAELAAERLLVLDGDGWHRGVIGILASRVVERTAKPAIVICVEDGVAHGSGRSVDGFPLLEAIESCADPSRDLAAMLLRLDSLLPAAALPELKQRLRCYAIEKLAAREPERVLHIHAELPLDRITPVLAGWLRKLEPLGARQSRTCLCGSLCSPDGSPPCDERTSHPAGSGARIEPFCEPRGKLWRDSRRGLGYGFRAAELGLHEGSRIDLAYRHS